MYQDKTAHIVANENFNKARLKDIFFNILNFFTPENYRLLSFDEVRILLKPDNTRYEGLKSVPVRLIIGSEGRYKDFNKAFLPRYNFLRSRWSGIDSAHLKDIILPPVKLYEIGGVYFVSDGNHRISVAKNEGREYVDAEITSLKSKIKLRPDITTDEIKEEIIKYEKKEFFKNKEIREIIDRDKLDFTVVGSFNETIEHIAAHKYFINLDKNEEIPYSEAVRSWYYNLFLPIYNIVLEDKLLMRFPGRTAADMYVWIINHWGFLKKKYGQNFTITKAARDYSEQFGKSFWEQILSGMKKIFRIK